uniref:Uncharacterized protein n=1 Tax=Rhizophora mucronata TaxID=61149 RepID=A0A2P2MZ45_RHIMU
MIHCYIFLLLFKKPSVCTRHRFNIQTRFLLSVT